jgi:hypothetical protein
MIFPSNDFIELRDELLQAAADEDWDRYRSLPVSEPTCMPASSTSFFNLDPSKCYPSVGAPQQTEALYISSLNRSLRALRQVMAD